jgi:hypothetical protein
VSVFVDCLAQTKEKECGERDVLAGLGSVTPDSLPGAGDIKLNEPVNRVSAAPQAAAIHHEQAISWIGLDLTVPRIH